MPSHDTSEVTFKQFVNGVACLIRSMREAHGSALADVGWYGQDAMLVLRQLEALGVETDPVKLSERAERAIEIKRKYLDKGWSEEDAEGQAWKEVS